MDRKINRMAILGVMFENLVFLQLYWSSPYRPCRPDPRNLYCNVVTGNRHCFVISLMVQCIITEYTRIHCMCKSIKRLLSQRILKPKKGYTYIQFKSRGKQRGGSPKHTPVCYRGFRREKTEIKEEIAGKYVSWLPWMNRFEAKCFQPGSSSCLW